MTNAIERRNENSAAMMEQVIVGGDLAQLKPHERLSYYRNVCESVGLNPLTKPFEYIKLNGKLTLYARRDAADQLRRIRGISLARPEIEYGDDLVIVTVVATDRDGRSDADVGAVALTGLRGEARANAIMKAITKAKRRVTLSIAGLGWLDETEAETVPGAQRVVVGDTGEIVDAKPTPSINGTQPATPGVEADVDMGMGGDDYPFEDAQTEAEQPERLSAKTLKRLHALGTEVYGDAWDAKRPELVQAATKGAATSASDLTETEAAKLIDGMNRKRALVA